MKNHLYIICALWICITQSIPTYGYNLRFITNEDGLTNSAILSICQGRDGLIWIGTCDGINLYDGLTVKPLSLPDGKELQGNIIEDIIETEPDIFWIQTNYGLNRLDRRRQTVSTYSQFHGRHRLRKNRHNDLFVLTEDNKIYYRHHTATEFHKLDFDTPISDIIDIHVADTLQVFSRRGIGSYPLTYDSRHNYIIVKEEKLFDNFDLQYGFVDGNTAYIVDGKQALHAYDLATKSKTYLLDLQPVIAHRGAISDIVRRGDDLFIAFQTDGVVKISLPADKESTTEDIGIKSGIFRLLKDRYQDIVWIGTDGQGTCIYSEDAYSLRSITYADLHFNIAKPVRSLFLDRDNSLWLGTKGEGILRIDNYGHEKPVDAFHVERLTTRNSNLPDNSAYAFAESSRPLFWIGSDEGVSYYSYTAKSIKTVRTAMPLRYVHSLQEVGDSLLWIGTVGTGVYKARIGGTPENPQLTGMEHYTIDNGNFSSNYFFSLCRDEGTMIFGNRGYGAFRVEDGSLRPIVLHDQHADKTVNDVFAIAKQGGSLWLGTGHGVICHNADSERCFGRKDGWPNHTTHAMLFDNRGQLWVAINGGVIRLQPDNGQWQIHDRNNGLKVVEFSDGASLRMTDGALLFGGINGLVVIREDSIRSQRAPHMPSLKFAQLSISGREVNLYDRLKQRKGDDEQLQLEHDENYFRLTFIAPDYLHANNYSYLYKINGKTEWIDQGNSNVIPFTQLAPGEYTLYVKYHNLALGKESPVYSLSIRIRPPWYLSDMAKAIYLLLLLAAIAAAAYAWLLRVKRKQEAHRIRLEQEQREEVYEEKLRFFTNITHEFCTPLTLIHIPCERILNYKQSDEYIRKYIGLIKQNAERLNMLIQEIIEFRRIETGHKMRRVQAVPVSRTCSEITASFADLAEQNRITLEAGIEPEITWNTDLGCFTKIASNLLSNAFKYTSVGGTVRIGLSVADGKLRFTVYNTGKGIKPEDHDRIFNRYSILDNVEENAVKGLSSRNGLGMAICHSMVELLEGSIDIESEVGRYACFIVTLPALPLTDQAATEAPCPSPQAPAPADTSAPQADEEVRPEATATAEPAPDGQEKRGEKHILVVDDSTEMQALLHESFSADYRVTTAGSGEEALEALRQEVPDLIITDIMMPGTNGLELTRQIKQNKHTMHIPLIILSAKNTGEEKAEGILSGADAYVGKPFNISYLKALADRMIGNREQMREYYNTSASAYEFANGKLMQKEDKAFMESVIRFIDDNIDNSELTQEDIAEHLQVSVRSLYRKFKELEQLPPKDFVKEYRITYAAKLLQTTTLTIQEVIYRCGFVNRSHFYKEFAKRFQMTPKDYRNEYKQKDGSL